MEKVTLADLINYAYEDNPAKIQSSFDSIMADKIQQSLQQKRIEIANSLFNNGENEVDGEEQVEDEEVVSDEENSETEEEESE